MSGPLDPELERTLEAVRASEGEPGDVRSSGSEPPRADEREEEEAMADESEMKPQTPLEGGPVYAQPGPAPGTDHEGDALEQQPRWLEKDTDEPTEGEVDPATEEGAEPLPDPGEGPALEPED